ncbi:SpoIID/LytB domain-containing protein [Neobacillus drentensis]|uniref:SpoIID/LytB domain-containing protein n=1 Tax=Neobacillus drentensis TaxID=220684 RepID=UPI002FFE6826
MSKAAELKDYSNKVNVSVYKSASLTLKLNNVYQLTNNQTGTITTIPPNTTISVKNNGTNIDVSYSGMTLTSASGFKVQELSALKKLVIFLQDTQMRKGASSSYQVIYTFTQGSNADYLDSFTNAANETWYKVSNGTFTGWIPSQSVTLIDSTTSTTSIGALSNGLSYRGSFNLTNNGSDVEVSNYLEMEDYLKGVVPSEMPASWSKEALKAQAIAARSYAATSMGLTSTPSSQVYRGFTGEDARTNEAVKETEGLMAKFAGRPIMTFFYSTSGGQTANYADVWGGSGKEYYTSVSDPYENSPYSSWSETFSAASILKSFGYTDSLTKLFDITLKKTGANGEVTGVTVKTSAGDKTIEGNESKIRKLFAINDASHYNQINSNWFTMTVLKGQSELGLTVQTIDGTEPLSTLKGQVVQTASGQVTLADSNVDVQTADGVITSDSSAAKITSVTLHGKGWGHRIGMSQYGAKGMAEHGWDAKKIIEYYFQGTTVSR